MRKPPLPLARMRWFATLTPEEQMAVLARCTPDDLLILDAWFEYWAHKGQLPPSSIGWRVWLMLAGRGYGKTRAGAEWITRLATQQGRPVRIALAGATIDDVRQVMIEGESGLLAVGQLYNRRPHWEPSLRRLRWPGGSEAAVFSGENPDGLRGHAHHFAWCDELAKWGRPEETWTNLELTLRIGERPRALVTTTPRQIPILTKIRGQEGTVETGGTSADNPHLPPEFLRAMAATYGGTRIGRQELNGELIADVEGALWTRDLIEKCRHPRLDEDAVDGAGNAFLTRVVIGVDPPASATGDACGIVAVGRGRDGVAYVLGDHSVSGLRPEGWARRVADAAALHRAERVVAEKNMGGDMVESVLRGAEVTLPVRTVSASRGKIARAEPVATLFEGGRARFAGAFPELEDELAGMCIGGRYQGPGRSPDRADALVWAMTELMLGERRAMPRITVF